jgi:hypothetical protein
MPRTSYSKYSEKKKKTLKPALKVEVEPKTIIQIHQKSHENIR